MTVHVEPDRDVSLQGNYAGIVTRLAAFGVDVLVAATLFTLGGNVVEYLLSSLLGEDVSLQDAPVVSVVALAVWLLVYFAYPIAASGRTLGMALAGLVVVTTDGQHVGAGRALLRTICIPLSLILLGIGASDDPDRPSTASVARPDRRHRRCLRMGRACGSPTLPRQTQRLTWPVMRRRLSGGLAVPSRSRYRGRRGAAPRARGTG